MNTEERYPLRLTEENSFCFGAIGLSDSAHAAVMRERFAGEVEEVSKANERAFSYFLKADLFF